MKIAYPMRVDAVDKPGGDSLVTQKLIAAGRSMVDGLTMFDGEILTDLNADLSRFDLVHLTNIDRPVETYHSYCAARAARKPVVISPIHHSYREIGRYEREGRGGAIGVVSGRLGFVGLEYLRCIARSMSYPQLMKPTIRMMVSGMRAAQVAVLEGASRVLVLTEKERRDIVREIGKAPKARFEALRNGFDPDFSSESAAADRIRDIDVCVVARIEARKNQIGILKALEVLGLSGVFVGRENKNHRSYCDEFRSRIAKSKSAYIGGLPHKDAVGIMRRSRVHISASWFEVSSLVDIEAYLCGCRVVSSMCGGTREILGERAVYVDPGSPVDIQRGIAAAMQESSVLPAPKVDDGIVESWNAIGRRLADIYRNTIDEGLR